MHPSAFLVVWVTLWVSTHITGETRGGLNYVFRALSLGLALCCQSPARVTSKLLGGKKKNNMKIKADKKSYGLFPYNAKGYFSSLRVCCKSVFHIEIHWQASFIFFPLLFSKPWEPVLKNEWSYKREKSADLTRLPAPEDNDCAASGHHYEYQRPTAKLNSGSSPHH